MSDLEAWQTISVGTVLTFRVPPGAQERQAQPIDSLVGIFCGDGYEITYDYGRYGEPIEAYRSHPEYSVSERLVAGREAKVATFVDREGSPRLPYASLLRLEDGPNSLTLRVSCSDRETCSLAETVFDSVEVR